MRTIYKYPCPPAGGLISYHVSNGQIIHVGLDGREFPCMWVELDPDFEHSPVDFFVVGTGWALPEKAGFRQLHAGSWIDNGFVWHLYRWVDESLVRS